MSKQAYSKAKGRTWETAICQWLRMQGIPAERRRLTGAQDCGDVGGWAGVVLEAKSCKTMDLAGWSDELQTEIGNAERRFGGAHTGIIFARRRGQPGVADGYAIMPTGLAVDALKALLEKNRG